MNENVYEFNDGIYVTNEGKLCAELKLLTMEVDLLRKLYRETELRNQDNADKNGGDPVVKKTGYAETVNNGYIKNSKQITHIHKPNSANEEKGRGIKPKTSNHVVNTAERSSSIVPELSVGLERNSQNNNNNITFNSADVDLKAKNSRKILTGKCKDNSPSIKGAPIITNIYVGTICGNTGEEEMKNFLKTNWPDIEIRCTKLNSKGTNSSFKLSFEAENRDRVLDDSMWPSGVLVKNFFHWRQKQPDPGK
ncbi:hypothetical protein WA026_010062 [Henosepilachna vigintioctopunctata]|uniref:RRM domain-containing protein n=1 Tax=Henosepilachna vigintioctopunctata TaxID=420089 RepID=A0AAW1UH71_9CUCU